jgi:hypothetical protein
LSISTPSKQELKVLQFNEAGDSNVIHNTTVVELKGATFKKEWAIVSVKKKNSQGSLQSKNPK